MIKGDLDFVDLNSVPGTLCKGNKIGVRSRKKIRVKEVGCSNRVTWPLLVRKGRVTSSESHKFDLPYISTSYLDKGRRNQLTQEWFKDENRWTGSRVHVRLKDHRPVPSGRRQVSPPYPTSLLSVWSTSKECKRETKKVGRTVEG